MSYEMYLQQTLQNLPYFWNYDNLPTYLKESTVPLMNVLIYYSERRVRLGCFLFSKSNANFEAFC